MPGAKGLSLTIKQWVMQWLDLQGIIATPQMLIMEAITNDETMEKMKNRWDTPHEQFTKELKLVILFSAKVIVNNWLKANMPSVEI